MSNLIKNNPWLRHYYSIGQRIKDNKWYKNRKCLISKEEVKTLWMRDKADKMETPSLDRINNGGDYTFKNCRFIERRLNSSLARTKTTSYVGISYDNYLRARGRKKLFRGQRYKERTDWFMTEKEAVAGYTKKFGVKPIKWTATFNPPDQRRMG